MPVFLVKGQLRQNYFLKKQAVMEKQKQYNVRTVNICRWVPPNIKFIT